MKGGYAPTATELYMSQEERAEILSDIEKVDAETESARAQGNFQNLLACLERSLFLRRRLYPEASDQVAAACKQLCEVCNYCATSMLQQGNLRAAQDLLKRAQQVAEKSDVDLAITLNNLACFYRRTGKLRTALTFLERALAIEERLPEADTSQTHLNLCATLSQLRRHDRALYHAQCATIRMYEIMAPLMRGGEFRSGGELSTETRERMSVLCIAYHNLAVEHEYLKNYQSALGAYREGIRWAKEFLGESHQIHQILQYSFNAVSKAMPQRRGRPGSGSRQPGAAAPPFQMVGPQDAMHAGPVGDVPEKLSQLITPRDAHPATLDGEDVPAGNGAQQRASPGATSPRASATSIGDSQLYASDSFIEASDAELSREEADASGASDGGP